MMINRQMITYLAIGATQYCIDVGLFASIVYIALHNTSQTLSLTLLHLTTRFIAGIVGFYLNGRYTFSQQHLAGHALWSRFPHFLISWAALSAISTVVLTIFWNTLPLLTWFNEHIDILAKLLTEISMVFLSFVILKLFVYRAKDYQNEQN